MSYFHIKFPEVSIGGEDPRNHTAMGTGDTPEKAMKDCVERHCYFDGPTLQKIISGTNWQPSSGLVFIYGQVCGLVHKV